MRLILALLLLVSTHAWGEPTTAYWNNPTHNEDGTPVTDLDAMRLSWGRVRGHYPNSVTVPHEPEQYTFDPGFCGWVYVVGESRNTQGEYSIPSNPIRLDATGGQLCPPGDTTIYINYDLDLL